MTTTMTDDRKRTGKKAPATPLIERAARAIQTPEVSDRAPPRARASGATAQAPVRAAPAAPAHQEPAAPVRAPAPRAAPRRERKSRYEEIDFASLQKQGMLTPSLTRSQTMEEFRVIKRGVLQHALQPGDTRGKPNNMIMVTSARPGEGKTFTAINLAISIALERDFTVLLIDADFSRPSILKVLGLEAKKGLIDVLENPEVDLSEVLIRTNIDKLTVLPAGGAHDLSTELLASLRMRDIVQDIARRYRDRIVIFDSPPMLATSEACALATHMGQVVFVVEADKTPKSAVREALDMIDTGTRVGLVLNHCQVCFSHTQSGYYSKR